MNRVFFAIIFLLFVNFTFETKLHEAVTKGDLSAVRALIAGKVDVNESIEEIGTTVFIFAAINRQFELSKILIDANADVNLVDKNGVSVLLCAATFGPFDFVKMLIDQKAHVNQADQYKSTALSMAVQFCRTKIVQLLLEAKSDANHADKYDITPLMLATGNLNSRLVDLLVFYGADTSKFSEDQLVKNALELKKEIKISECEFSSFCGLVSAFQFDPNSHHVEVVHETVKSKYISFL